MVAARVSRHRAGGDLRDEYQTSLRNHVAAVADNSEVVGAEVVGGASTVVAVADVGVGVASVDELLLQAAMTNTPTVAATVR